MCTGISPVSAAWASGSGLVSGWEGCWGATSGCPPAESEPRGAPFSSPWISISTAEPPKPSPSGRPAPAKSPADWAPNAITTSSACKPTERHPQSQSGMSAGGLLGGLAMARGGVTPGVCVRS